MIVGSSRLQYFPWREYKLLLVLIAMQVCLCESAAVAVSLQLNQQELQAIRRRREWNMYVQGFRDRHNFAVYSGIAQGYWHVHKFGDIKDITVLSRAQFLKFSYAFHLPLFNSLGYFLGTSLGYYYESTVMDKRYVVSPSYHLPGLMLGLAFDFSESFRLQLGAESYLERINDVKIISDSKVWQLSANYLTWWDAFIVADFFYRLEYAFRVTFHSRYSTYQAPKSAGSLVTAAKITKRDNWLGIGIVYHLL